MEKGDIVALRGDKRPKRQGTYSPEQLIQGKYVKHTGHCGIWIGVIEKTKMDCGAQWASVGGMLRTFDQLELIHKKEK